MISRLVIGVGYVIMKNRILSLLLVAIMACSLCACGGSAETNNIDSASEKENTNKNSILTEYVGGFYGIAGDRLEEIVEVVELTTENWREYFKVHSYNKEIVHKDEFGDITSSETVAYNLIGANSDKYYKFDNAIIELKNKETGELTTYNLNDDVNGIDSNRFVTEDFDLDNYECTRIKGYLYFVDIPTEALISPFSDYCETGFYIIDGGARSCEIDTYTKEIYAGSWEKYFK